MKYSFLEKPLQYKIQRCDSSFVQGRFECEQAFDGDITKVDPRDSSYILGWAYGGKIPSSVIFYLEGFVSINTIIFKTALNRHDHHLNNFAIDVLVDNEFKPVNITRVNVANSKIDGNKVQTNGEMNIRVTFNTMNKVSAIKLHAYGSDAPNENSVINEIYALLLKDKYLLWVEDDVDAILNTAVVYEGKNITGCPAGWSFFESNCYKVFTKTLSGEDAENYCQVEGGHLASIHSEGENDFVALLDSDQMRIGGD